MSSAFSVTKDNFQQAAKMEELRRAFSERVRTNVARVDPLPPGSCYSIGAGYLHKTDGVPSPAFLYDPAWGYQRFSEIAGVGQWLQGDGTSADVLPAGIKIQKPTLISRMQEVIACTCHIHTKDKDDLSAGTQIRFGLTPGGGCEEFFQYVGGGLYTNTNNWGFRRAFITDETGAPVMTRGFAQPGDILGPWIIEDLVACFQNWTTTICGFDGRSIGPGFGNNTEWGADLNISGAGGHATYSEYEGGPIIDIDVPPVYVSDFPLIGSYSDALGTWTYWATYGTTATAIAVIPIASTREFTWAGYSGLSPNLYFKSYAVKWRFTNI
jgi:hypothetical protein